MKRVYYRYAALYTCYYMALGATMPLIGQYLSGIGFSGTQIGVVTGAGTLTAIFASAFWGKIYQQSRRKHRLLLFLCLAAGTIAVFLTELKWYPVFLWTYSFMYFLQSPVMALSDAVTIEDKQPFHQIRKWGAAGFAFGVFFAGRLAEWIGLGVIFRIYTICFFLSAGLLFLLGKEHREEIDGSTLRKRSEGRYASLLKDKKLLQLIVCTFFVGGTNVANNTYFSFLYIEGGGTIAGMGLTMLLMVGSEAPFMAWSSRLSKTFTMEKVILAAIGISAMRFALYGLELPHLVLTFLFFSQGAVNGIILVEFVRYVSKLAPRGQRGMAIAVYYAVGSNGSGIVCQLIGGKMLDSYGPGGVYFFFAIWNLIGLILYVSFSLYKKL